MREKQIIITVCAPMGAKSVSKHRQEIIQELELFGITPVVWANIDGLTAAVIYTDQDNFDRESLRNIAAELNRHFKTRPDLGTMKISVAE